MVGRVFYVPGIPVNLLAWLVGWDNRTGVKMRYPPMFAVAGLYLSQINPVNFRRKSLRMIPDKAVKNIFHIFTPNFKYNKLMKKTIFILLLCATFTVGRAGVPTYDPVNVEYSQSDDLAYNQVFEATRVFEATTNFEATTVVTFEATSQSEESNQFIEDVSPILLLQLATSEIAEFPAKPHYVILREPDNLDRPPGHTKNLWTLNNELSRMRFHRTYQKGLARLTPGSFFS
jgi:hypothetical protein